MVTTKKRKVEKLKLWNEDILYEIVLFLKKIKDIIYLAQTCQQFYNWILNNENILNLIFKNYKFKKIPEIIPNYLYNLKYLQFPNIENTLTEEQLLKFTKLENLFLSNYFNFNSSIIEKFKNLKKLSLKKYYKKINFEIVKDNLTELNINILDNDEWWSENKHIEVKDEEISCLQNLTSLNISNVTLNGSCLLNFTKLKKLEIIYSLNIEINENLFINLIHLEDLKLNSFYKFTGKFLKTLTNLKTLILITVGHDVKLKEKYFKNLINLKELSLELIFFRNILNLKLPNSLEILNIRKCCYELTDEILENLENLKVLNISGCKNVKGKCLNNMVHLKDLNISDTIIMETHLINCKNVQNLNVYCCYFITENILLQLKNITHLVIGFYNKIDINKFTILNNLKHLRIEQNYFELNDSVILKFPNLESLELISCVGIEGEYFYKLKKLKCLSICAVEINDNYLKNLDNLEKLIVNQCFTFTGKCLQYLKRLKCLKYKKEVNHNSRTFKNNDLKEVIKKLKCGFLIDKAAPPLIDTNLKKW